MLPFQYGYHVTTRYDPSKEMLLEDPLSHYVLTTTTEFAVTVVIHHVQLSNSHKAVFLHVVHDDPLWPTLPQIVLLAN